MYCNHCGTEIPDDAKVCPECGETTGNVVRIDDGIKDEGGFLWGLLGCCVPIAGLILFLVWKDTKPKTARAAGKGALISVILAVLYYVFIIVLGIGAAVIGSSM